jgi:cytidylate kinase
VTPAPARRLVIAIDGPAGAGKSTTARAVAARLGYLHIDSGAMYRVVGLAARARGVDPGDAAALAALVDVIDIALRNEPTGPRVFLDGRDVTAEIRAPGAGEWASRVAAVPQVRAHLVARQRALAVGGGVVMDGRDIGTVVFPDADCKFFLVASADERARRHQGDLLAAGTAGDLAVIRAEIEARDRRDRERAHAPLRAAPDAIVIDTSQLSPEAVATRMLEAIRARARP